MPEIIEKHAKTLHLVISAGNLIILMCGFLWAAAIWYGDTKSDAKTVLELQAKVLGLQAEILVLKVADQATIGMVRDGQDKTSNRLTALETQNSFILQGLNELKASVAGIKRPL